MKRKDELKLDILSNIKDEIIDAQSEKRYKLMTRKRRPKWIIPSSVAAVLLIAIMIPLFVILFSKQVPIYEGMSVLSSYTPAGTASNGSTEQLSVRDFGKPQFDFLTNDNGNHYGHNKKPVEDIVEDDASTTLTVPDQQMYYAKANQDIYINIHFSNPDDFVILSFVFNGKTYSSYMFEEGSDMENIIIKCNVGDVEGITEYTIDAIKYVDGTAIKDVVMAGDRTVKVGVYAPDKLPAAQITEEVIGINDISLTASVNDQLGLIEMSEGNVFAVICSDDAVIAQQELTVGENNVKFEGLTKGTTYRYAIVANYDSLDGTGFSTYILYEKQFTTKKEVAIIPTDITQDSISFTLEWEESFENKVLDSLALYRGEEKVRELDVNATSVDGLLSNNEYRLVATYTNKGETETSDLIFATQAKATPEITITENNKTQTSLKFDISVTDIDSVGAITKLEIIHGEDVQNISDLNIREFTNLLSNNKYTVKVTYTYDLNDGVGEHTIVKTVDVTTDAKATPEIAITENNKTQTSLGFDISVTDIDSVGAITKLEIVHGEDVQNISDLNIREFTNLLSNNKYTVKVTYTYDLNDGVGNQTVEKAVDITTEEKAEPVFTFKNMVSETYSVSGEYDVANIDGTLISYKVELYRGNELVKENTDKEITFDSLDYYTDYTVKITYTFDVNDGKGVQTKTAEYTIKTLPYIDVTECKIANTSAVSEGETIFMQVKLDNPLDMTIESVVVNGETYSVTGASTTNRIFVEIVYSDQFAGGDTYLKVDKVNAKIDTTTLAVAPKTELSDNVFINGKLEVLKLEFVNESFEPIDWAFPSETVYVMITLDNPTGYTVDNINENSNIKLTKLDDNHWYYKPYTWGFGGWQTKSLDSLSYKNEYVEKTLTYSNTNISCYVVESDNTVYISTPDDLKNMNGCYYYEMTNDIDLSGIEWLGNSFAGAFDGKGYSIRNMSFVGTERSNASCLGLFAHGTGVIKNLTMEKVTIIADVIPNSNNDVVINCGSIVAYAQGVYLENCSTDEDCLISVTANRTITDGGPASVGGLIGGIYDSSIPSCKIEGCVNYASVSVQDNYAGAGGILGNSTYPVIITGCTNYGTISSNIADVIDSGGTIACGITSSGGGNANVSKCINYGAISSDGEAWGISVGGNISKCINYGTVSSSIHAGGIGLSGDILDCINYGSVSGVSYVGGITSDGGNIKNCLNVGKINDRDATINGITGDFNYCKISGCITISTNYNYSWLEFENCYGTDSGPIEKICTVNQLNSKEFYTETLGWSEDIWDFSELDYENGKYPKLK